MTLGVMASAIPMMTHLSYCPDCVEADRQEWGEPYWHRSHQCPGVMLCHKHLVPLYESRIDVSCKDNKHLFHCLAANCHTGSEFSVLENHYDHYIWLAQQVHRLLCKNADPPGLEALQQQYLNLLDAKGLISVSGRVRQAYLATRFQAFYGREFLVKMDSDLDCCSDSNWLATLVRKPRKAMHPLRHLLLLRFLETSPSMLLETCIPAQKPFGEPPYPCLNLAARHYSKLVIPKVVVTRHTSTGRPVGNFYCRCGFAYARTGPERCDADRMKRTRILSFGPVWDNELLRLDGDPTVSLRQKARWLGVDANTIKKHLARLCSTPSAATDHDEQNTQRNIHRNKLVQAIQDYPKKSRTQIRQQANATYTWLYRHDRAWLMKNLPKRRRRKKSVAMRVDWKERDRIIQLSTQAAIKEILGNTERPQRITLSRIGKMTGSLPLLEKHLDKLPRTRRMINKHRESVEDFQLRRVRIVIQKMKEEYEPLDEWRIVRRAGLRPGFSDKVAAEIESKPMPVEY